MINLRLGDKITVKTPSGTIITGGEVVSIQPQNKTCEVYWYASNSHLLCNFDQLLAPF